MNPERGEITFIGNFSTLGIHEPINAAPAVPLASAKLPSFDFGDKEDLRSVLEYLELPYFGDPPTQMAMVRARRDSIILERKTIPQRTIPSVVGMGLKDALFVLENLGLQVTAQGVGKVALQSVRPGTPARGQGVRITLR